MQRKQVSLRLGADTCSRAARLVPLLAKSSGFVRVHVSRSLVMQLALDRGLEILERETHGPTTVLLRLRPPRS